MLRRCFHFQNKMESDYQILNLVQMMDQITLEQFSSKIMCSNTKEMISEEIQTCSSNSESIDVPQMRTPEHINDHHKVSWMIKDNTPVELLMSQPFPRMDECLNHYFGLVSRRTSPFSFVQVYPHSHHLKANKRIRKDELVFAIGSDWFLTKSNYTRTRIGKYLRKLDDFMRSKSNIFEYGADSKRIMKAVSSCLQFQDVLYIFQFKFVLDICNAAYPLHPVQQAQWLYFQLLPASYDYMPINHIEAIQKYHSSLGISLGCQKQNIQTIFGMLKQLVDGKGIRKQYQFRTCIIKQEVNGQLFYERYQQMTTLENYLWSACCERTRVYQKQNGYHKQTHATYTEEVYIPILDLLHHSYVKPNIRWEYDAVYKQIRVFAMRDIECGQLLSTYYGAFSIQSAYNYYGFVDIDSECAVSIPFAISAAIFIQILESHYQLLLPAVKYNMLQTIESEQIEPIVLSFSTAEYQTLSIQDFLAKTTMYAAKELLKRADYLYHVSLKHEQEQPYRMRKHKIKRKFKKELKRDGNLMKQICRDIKKSIEQGISKKKGIIRDISYELQRQLPFNVEYNLMCIHTILHKEKGLLEAFRNSIYSVNKWDIIDIIQMS